MNLKKYRYELNKTQQQIAEEIGMPRTMYARYENGSSQPDMSMLIKLADYFHVTIDNLLEHSVPYLLDKSTLSKSQRNIIDLLPYMSDSVCNMAEAYISGLIAGEQAQQTQIQRFKK